MDKWKDIELEKMKVGGNRAAREFFESQDDYDDTAPILQRYNTKAAALYKDKVKLDVCWFRYVQKMIILCHYITLILQLFCH